MQGIGITGKNLAVSNSSYGSVPRAGSQSVDICVAGHAGDESQVMLDAHAEAGYAVGTPFAHAGAYDFAQHGALTRRVSDLGAVMLRHRLTAPPEEAYSLHRKLAGAYLACIKLRARVPCRQLFLDMYDRHVFDASGSGGAPRLPKQQQAA